jgi:hypothetical protein
VLLAGTVLLIFERGGSQPEDQLRAAAVSFVVLGLLAVLAPWPLVRSRWGLAAAGALVGLAGWTALSITWARIEVRAANDLGRLTLYAAAFASALIVMRSPRVRRATPWALLLGITAAAVYGLGTRLLPDIFKAAVFGNAGARLSHPVTYWNGLGMLTATGVLLGIACAAERGGAPRGLRAVACAFAVPCGFACYMTLSRGSFVAIVAGLVVLMLMRPRAGTVLTAVCALVPVGVLAVVLQGLGDVKGTPHAPPVQSSQGVGLAVLVVALSALAGGALALLAPRLDRRRALWRPPFRLAAALAIGATAVILVAIVAVSYASEQSEELPTSASRVTEAKTFRGPYWDVALDSFADHPLSGIGSGSFVVAWRRANVVPRGAFDAHSLYFETLGELGIVGGLLLVVLLVSIALGVVAAARELPRDPVLPAAAAVLAAAAVHVGVDWDWEQAGVTLPVLLLVAAALTRPEPGIDSPQ